MSNLPIDVENGFIAKIKKFFRSLFYKEIEEKTEIEDKKQIIENNKKEEFDSNLKIELKEDYSKKLKRDDFVKEFEKRPEKLWDLSNERLEQLNKYYDTEIAELERKIKMVVC